MTHNIPPSPAALSTKKRKLAEEGDHAGHSKLPRSTKLEPIAVKHGLRIVTASTALELPKSPSVDSFLSDSDADSLFDECLPEPQTDTDDGSACRTVGPLVNDGETLVPARLTTPSVPGLFFDPTSLLPEDFAEDLMWTCIRAFFKDGAVNQVMLFERAAEGPASEPRTRLPPFLLDLLSTLSELLLPSLPPDTHALLFPPPGAPVRARQAILNLYWPGEGITPHVDLLDRYDDGIIGVSLGSGCVMQFDRVRAEGKGASRKVGLYLPRGSVIVMTGEARYGWTHGIEKRLEDLVEESPGSARGMLVDREVRLSITFRWLLPGADVVGGPDLLAD